MDARIYPLLDVSRAQLEALVEAPIIAIEPVLGGFTNTLHRVTLATGGVVIVKHFAGPIESYRDELSALTKLAGVLPVPEVVRVDAARRVIVYRFIAGITLDDCRRSEPPAAFASLADPLGRLFAWVARTEPIVERDAWNPTAVLAQTRRQLADSRAHERMGGPLAEALTAAYTEAADRLTWGHACLCHHDIGGRNILVQQADGDRWRIGGVIDWEAATTGSPLVDLGGLFRYSARYDDAFRAEFERGYLEASGTLPDGWYLTARLLDAVRVIDMLDVARELPGVFADCRMLLAKLVADLA
ncbi:MAG: aminoglycoside phosphotransferase family protein [Kofleriaceae bacterium]